LSFVGLQPPWNKGISRQTDILSVDEQKEAVTTGQTRHAGVHEPDVSVSWYSAKVVIL